MARKYCGGCRQNRNVQRFSRNKRRADGLQNWCKDCMLAYQARWVEANRAHYLATQKAWRDANPNYKRDWLARQEEKQPHDA